MKSGYGAGRTMNLQAARRARIFNVKRTSANKKISGIGRKIVDFAKDWGGVLTLLIALIYTFPISVLDRFTSSEEKTLSQARQVLADGSSMVIEKITNSAKLTDLHTQDLLGRMYGVKFYNLIYVNRDLIGKAEKSLRSSELATFAGLLTFSGLYQDAIPYYDAAIARAAEEKSISVNIVRDKAQLYQMATPMQNIDMVRKLYIDIFNSLIDLKSPLVKQQFYVFLYELSYAEALIGDWTCAGNLNKEADAALYAMTTQAPALLPYLELFRTTFASAKQSRLQSTQGCSYAIPIIDG